MSHCLLTGGSGYIGLALAKRLVKEGHTVSLVVRKNFNKDIFGVFKDKININKHDGTTESLCNILNIQKPDTVFHLAAYFAAQHKLDDIIPMIQSNILFGTQLLEASVKSGVQYFINTGTHWQHYNNELYNPVCLYAAAKKSFEIIAKYYIETYKIRMLTIKLIDTYGPFDQRPKVMSLLKRIALSGKELDMSPGEQEMGFLYIDDVVLAFLYGLELIKTMKEGECKSVIAAPKKFYTLKEVVHIFERAINKKLNINWGKRPYRQREMMKIWTGDKNILEDVETIDLYEGTKKMLVIEGLLNI